MKTEAEARKCWCPFTKVLGKDKTASYNRNPNAVDQKWKNTACIASECMAWRWYYDEDRVERGFCGLAGSTGIQRNSNP